MGSLQAAATRDTTEQLDKSLGEFLTNHSYIMVAIISNVKWVFNVRRLITCKL